MKQCGINLKKDVKDTKNYKTLIYHILVQKIMFLIKVIQKRMDIICSLNVLIKCNTVDNFEIVRMSDF